MPTDLAPPAGLWIDNGEVALAHHALDLLRSELEDRLRMLDLSRRSCSTATAPAHVAALDRDAAELEDRLGTLGRILDRLAARLVVADRLEHEDAGR